MLTLQQLLESDSIATIVAKLNANFQELSLSNGGPQGARGTQGIPGLPGKKGAIGLTGPAGETGTIAGIIPFVSTDPSGTAGVGPTAGFPTPNGQSVVWPASSWDWLTNYATPGTGTYTGVRSAGDVYIDHTHEGFWLWMTQEDTSGLSGPYYYNSITGGASYPDLGITGGWCGDGWYYYPEPQSAVSLSQVWVADTTTYLRGPGASGPYAYGPETTEAATLLSVPNARLVSKYGTVWITSGSDSINTSPDPDENLATETIGSWGINPGNTTPPAARPGRSNSGVDRLLFKMSLDSLPYLSNITARGFTALSGPAGAESIQYPAGTGAFNQMAGETFWVKPAYDVTLAQYTPLLFLSEKTDGTFGDYFSSLGLYMHTANDNPVGTTGEGYHKSIYLWSSRAAEDPTAMLAAGLTAGLPIDSATTVNYGEFVLDFRRLIASNQYVCSIPTDMKLSPEDGSSGSYTANVNLANRVYSGYISAINGKAMTGNPGTADYWEYGLGNFTPASYTAAGGGGGTHDPASGTAGMYTRNNWYGSAVLSTEPSGWENEAPGANDYIRVAGMLERGRRYQRSVGTYNNYLSELIFYTSQFRVGNTAAGFTGAFGPNNTIVDPEQNQHKSLPSLYISPFRNIGIGTFVGGSTASNDAGPIEPRGHLHVHTKYTSGNDDPTNIYNALSPSGQFEAPTHTFRSGVFSGENTGSTASSTILLIGGLSSPANELVNPGINTVTQFTGSLNSAVRADTWSNFNLSSLRFGTKGSTASADINTTTTAVARNEFQLHLHPMNRFANSGSIEATNPVGLGIDNHYPQARLHIYGKNFYNESATGQENRTPGGAATGPSGSYPYYASSTPYASNNQVVIDYLASSYVYPVGIKDYQYGGIGGSTAGGTGLTASYNAAVYPTRESKSPTRHYIPWTFNDTNYSYPSATGSFNGAYKHGGTGNAAFPVSSYLGFNIFRDISSADGHTGGDNADETRWVIGTSGPNGLGGANNGAAALVFSPDGELGIVTIPKGRDGGRAYQQWEQRGLGTRDVLNNMKVLFDSHGNIGVGNAPGWDYDAYPSLDRSSTTGKLNYVPASSITTSGPTASTGGSPFTIAYWNAAGQYGRVSYGTAGAETSALSPAALVNQRATTPEYVRLEIAAEKGWQGDGRMAERGGWGYPANLVNHAIVTPGNYLLGGPNVSSITSWGITTDAEGRITASTILYSAVGTASTGDFTTIIYPHPTEFTAGGPQDITAIDPTYIAPAGAQAAEWAGLSQEYLTGAYTGSVGAPSGGFSAASFLPAVTLVPRGGANVRLNNYVAGEGSESYPGEDTVARQTSPKLILSFLEKTPTSTRPNTGLTPYRKVNTVLLSAQNESSLREYYIPKADNTGGTLMVFTDHLGSKEHVDGFDTQLTSGTGYNAGGTGATGNIQKLLLTQVVTCEILMGMTAGSGGSNPIRGITDRTSNITGHLNANPFRGPGTTGGTGVTGMHANTKSIGYVNYFNTLPAAAANGTTSYFGVTASSNYGQAVQVVSPWAGGITGPGAGTANPGSATGINNTRNYVHASARRNIDFYYNVFQGRTSSYGGSMDASGWDSKATEIRFKRINSEYALVDFNITVEVKNPELPGATGSIGGDRAANYIDFAVPRMTQSLNFIYNADDDLANDGTENTWGNGPWMHMWSGYRNWLPGHAVVGDDLHRRVAQRADTPGRDGNVDSPYFNNTNTTSPTFFADELNMTTWTGNRLGAGYFQFTESPDFIGANSPLTVGGNSIFYDNLAGSPDQGVGIRDYFLAAPINRAQSAALFGALTADNFNTAEEIKAFSFMYFLPGYQSQWMGQTLSKTRPCSWRMLPTRYTETAGGAILGASNNTFKLEIMFDVPIMHTDHSFEAPGFYGSTVADDVNAQIQPYKYLTVSGQGIIRYGKTTQTSTSPIS